MDILETNALSVLRRMIILIVVCFLDQGLKIGEPEVIIRRAIGFCEACSESSSVSELSCTIVSLINTYYWRS